MDTDVNPSHSVTALFTATPTKWDSAITPIISAGLKPHARKCFATLDSPTRKLKLAVFSSRIRAALQICFIRVQYDDLLMIETSLDSSIRGGIKFDYTVFDENGARPLARGYTRHAFMDNAGKVVIVRIFPPSSFASIPSSQIGWPLDSKPMQFLQETPQGIVIKICAQPRSSETASSVFAGMPSRLRFRPLRSMTLPTACASNFYPNA